MYINDVQVLVQVQVWAPFGAPLELAPHFSFSYTIIYVYNWTTVQLDWWRTSHNPYLENSKIILYHHHYSIIYSLKSGVIILKPSPLVRFLSKMDLTWTWLEYFKMWWTWTWLDLTFFKMNLDFTSDLDLTWSNFLGSGLGLNLTYLPWIDQFVMFEEGFEIHLRWIYSSREKSIGWP